MPLLRVHRLRPATILISILIALDSGITPDSRSDNPVSPRPMALYSQNQSGVQVYAKRILHLPSYKAHEDAQSHAHEPRGNIAKELCSFGSARISAVDDDVLRTDRLSELRHEYHEQ